jgi:hypothetical protein
MKQRLTVKDSNNKQTVIYIKSSKQHVSGISYPKAFEFYTVRAEIYDNKNKLIGLHLDNIINKPLGENLKTEFYFHRNDFHFVYPSLMFSYSIAMKKLLTGLNITL